MTSVNNPEVSWKKIEAGLGAIAFGLIIFVMGWPSAILSIFAGFLTILGSGYLAFVPEVRFYLKLTVNWASHNQVFKNTGTIYGSNFVGNLDTGGGPVNFPLVQPKVPFLRAIVSLAEPSFGRVELQIDFKNIGDGIATDTEGQLVLEGGNPLKVLDTSPLNPMLPIGPGETALGRVSGVSDEILQSFVSFSLSINYKDVNGNAMKPIELKGTGDQLRKKLNDDSMRSALGQYGFK